MPCRSYDDEYVVENRALFERALRDKLARIACISLQAIEELYELMPKDQKSGTHIGEMLKAILENKDVQEWWPAHKEADAAEQERLRMEAEKKAAKEEKSRQRRQLIDRLSEEDKKILGVK